MDKDRNCLNKKFLDLQKPTIGVCYYPEHWPKNLWEDDLDRMLEHGIEVIRIAEFAWSMFEPQEGMFDFTFFDDFMELVNKKGMKVIFCTPTATPPAWLTHTYPEVLNAKQDGTLYRHGMRRHYNYNSPIYKESTRKIVEELASHYCPSPAVIGWQIDNELNCETDLFYSDSDHNSFREYLKNKYKTLDNLNECMGTTFWNQTYSSWDQIFLTRPTVNNSNNPHLSLEEKRFISYSTIEFCRLQADIIKKYRREDQFITTNGIFGHLDSHEMTDSCLDFITYDSYPNFAYDTWTEPKKPGNLNDRRSSWSLARTRSISPIFGIMEQQSGPGGWDSRMKQPAPKPGQMRLWTYQSLAHGADFISYFRWRTCWIGTEIYWHGLNDYSNGPNRRLNELKQIRDDFKKLHNIVGAKYNAQVAFLKDYDNVWDGEQDKWHGPLDEYSDNGWFTAAQLTHTPMDFYYLQKSTSLDEIQQYKLLIYPHATILTKETADLLKAYVENGGTLIMGSRTGYKDEYGRCPMRIMPGFAADICGVKVTDYTHLGPGDDEEYAIWDGEMIPAPVFNDILKADDNTEVLAYFKGNYYDGEPALTCKKSGKGRAYYYGAGFSTETAKYFLKKLGNSTPYHDLLELPETAELAVRSSEEADYLFILNYMSHSIEVDIKLPLLDLITEKVYSGKTEISKYEVMILKKLK
ncbi:MAG: beta-galactosidase [Anaerocolumna sp.]|jgi:beta-galactosidase|nr:beta-galactosidase [Anaerocolumna sp.]